MHKKILIATTNTGKIYEYKWALKQLAPPLEFIFLDSFKNVPAPDETGSTYEENAIIKAEYYFKHFNIPIISDDSGMEIEILNKIPGVHTARFFQEHKENTFQELESMILEKNSNNKNASFHCCAVYKDNNTIVIANARTNGLFTFPPKGKLNKSFGYDPIFKLPAINKTLAEIDIDIKLSYSPRVKVIKQILKELEQ